jgi:type I restriction enzyme S subunit
MFAISVNSNFLNERLDAGFYRPDFLSMDKALMELGAVKLGTLVSSVACGPFGGNAIADDLYAKDGVAFIRPVNISSHVFDDSALVRVPKKNLTENGLKTYEGTNIYFGRVGDPCVAIIDGETSISPNIIIACAKNYLADPYYIYSFAASRYGLQQLKRQLKTVAQPTTSTDAIRDLLIIKPECAVQKYIGDKVRQAELLRAWAKGLEGQFEAELRAAVPEAFENKATGKKYSRASVADITYTLNPGAFDEERLRVQRYLLQMGGRRFKFLAEISGATTNSYLPRTTYVGLDAIASGNCQLSPSTVQYAEIAGTCRVLTEGPVIAKLRPYLNKVSYIPKRLAGAVGSTELLCVSPIGSNSGWYLYGLLKSELTLKQLRPLATGATHPRIDQYDVYDLVMPVLDSQEELGLLLEQAQAAYFLSQELAKAAKFLVEALIEGQIDETQLIAAQEFLDAGRDELDRSILSRLKTDGLDGQGEPLFSDLDTLYDLLEQATAEQEQSA